MGPLRMMVEFQSALHFCVALSARIRKTGESQFFGSLLDPSQRPSTPRTRKNPAEGAVHVCPLVSRAEHDLPRHSAPKGRPAFRRRRVLVPTIIAVGIIPVIGKCPAPLSFPLLIPRGSLPFPLLVSVPALHHTTHEHRARRKARGRRGGRSKNHWSRWLLKGHALHRRRTRPTSRRGRMIHRRCTQHRRRKALHGNRTRPNRLWSVHRRRQSRNVPATGHWRRHTLQHRRPIHRGCLPRSTPTQPSHPLRLRLNRRCDGNRTVHRRSGWNTPRRSNRRRDRTALHRGSRPRHPQRRRRPCRLPLERSGGKRIVNRRSLSRRAFHSDTVQKDCMTTAVDHNPPTETILQ
jgi:hypothetical protein